MAASTFQRSAATLLSRGQIVVAIAAILLAGGFIWGRGYMLLLQTTIAAITLFYLLFVGLKLTVSGAALRAESYFKWLDNLQLLDHKELPPYTVYVPMYDEEIGVVRGVVEAITNLDYPAHKVQVLLLAEHKDKVTREALTSLQTSGELPSNFEIIVVPDINTQTTKPQACSYAYQFATGTYQVIFDAEDRPARDELRKAATAFHHMPNSVGCLQAELAFWNPRFSRVSTMYWGEYSTHFNTMLRGLSVLGLIPPLGGTSNHFRKEALEAVTRGNGKWRTTNKAGKLTSFRGPWDPHNLTEDADLAARLYEAGFIVQMLNSVTYEEAPTGLRASKNQRSRWLQGFAQTFFAWLRRPFRTMRKLGPVRWFCYNLLMGGTPLSVILNPITWATTCLYVGARITNQESVVAFIDQLFPTPVYYTGMLIAVFGNGLLWFQKLSVPIRRQEMSENIVDREILGLHGQNLQLDEYGTTKRLLFSPLWWVFTTAAGYRALRKTVIGDGRWDKTQHGHGLQQEAKLKQQLTK